jgi:hypothetical protein
MFIFNLKYFFQSNFFKMASILVPFSPGYPLGGGNCSSRNIALREIKCARHNETTAEHHPRGGLCVSRIPPEQKKRFPEVLCGPVEYRQSKNQTGCSLGNFPLCRNLNIARATLSGTTLL